VKIEFTVDAFMAGTVYEAMSREDFCDVVLTALRAGNLSDSAFRFDHGQECWTEPPRSHWSLRTDLVGCIGEMRIMRRLPMNAIDFFEINLGAKPSHISYFAMA
jgi:hypothetical protein